MEVLINEASFSLPVKAFNIDFAVVEKRQLPVVKEFVVRLIFSIEQCKPELIANFFGFKANEITDVLEDLEIEGLICWKDGDVLLSQYAKDRFEHVKGSSVPRFFEITEKNDTVFFDLFLFKIIPMEFKKQGNNRLSIDVPLPEESYSKLIDSIKSAFDEQFTFYQELRGVDVYEGSIDTLYKINNVQTQDDFIIPVKLDYYIDLDTNDVINRYNLEIIKKWDTDGQLFNAIDDAIVMKEGSIEKVSLKDIEIYINNTHDPFFRQVIATSTDQNNRDYISLNKLLNYYREETNRTHKENYQMIVGNIYTQDNLELIKKIIVKNVGKKQTKLLPGALWFANFDKKTWGRTSALKEVVEMINNIFDKRNRNASLVINTSCSNRAEAFQLNQAYIDSNAVFQSCSNLFNSERIEVLLIPDVLVVTFLHFSVIDVRELTVPIGFVCTNKAKIETITKNIKKWVFDSQDTKINDYFEKLDAAFDETTFGRVVVPVLEYYNEKEKKERKKRNEATTKNKQEKILKKK
jgi:hypothetical protein